MRGEFLLSEEAIKTSFGMRVRSIREASNMSQEKLAELSGLHRNYISDIERGRRNISIIAVYKIAKALDVKPGELL